MQMQTKCLIYANGVPKEQAQQWFLGLVQYLAHFMPDGSAYTSLSHYTKEQTSVPLETHAPSVHG